MRVGVLGGTFDPIHYGHLKIADQVQKLFNCDQILLMPAYIPPHKIKNNISSAYHRYAMAVLATNELEKIAVCTLELESPTQPFTVQTIAQLKKQFTTKLDLFFIMGTDLFRELNSWWRYQELIESCNIVVVTRPGYLVDLSERSLALKKEIKDLSNIFEVNSLELNSSTIFFTNLVAENISSTTIRLLVSKGQSITDYVPKSVANYIVKYQLYQDLSGSA
ncbi:MAG: nicotinate (nicotinamide) nucleotide adenylyltransferase [Blastocatellia bacterium]|nr:nicotinate (nicotinamide) nucleotide adenylyltransferase [Blastocatellia bacterium]MBL8192238.1 nicotinate (nicotinamide) nucleotide adenylyltransferase [Blastocatellia bacterium]MBN8722292.1 nicotinate-nucleotide adenylyltransferase [Acidobacteriota bacterium]